MRKITEAEVIYDAFMDTLFKKLPKDSDKYPKWYKERLSKCASCKFNTKNIPSGDLPLSLYISKKLGKDRCAICTCFIRQKAWSKTEQCALGEGHSAPSWMKSGYIGDYNKEKSRWNRRELVTMDSDEFNIISTDDKQYNIDINEDGTAFQIKFEPIEKGRNLEFSFEMVARHSIQISATEVGCGCTVPKMEMLNSKHFAFNVEINTSGFGVGHFKKMMMVKYHIKDEVKEREVPFEFLGEIVE